MRIGLQLTAQQIMDIMRIESGSNVGAKLAEIARTADRQGFYSLWFPDHLFSALSVYGITPIDAPTLEGYSTISYLAAVTKQIKVGLMVTCNLFRHPALLVKTMSTIDVLSGGRAYLGIGTGWFKREASGLGITFPPLRERLERLEETLRIAKHMWRGDTAPFEGKYYRLPEPVNSPQPLSKPHPPILIGGSGEKRVLRLVAKYADACNFSIGARTRASSTIKGLPVVFSEGYENRSEFVHRKLEVLKRHCEALGRRYENIEKTVVTSARLGSDQDRREIIDLCQELAGLGVDQIILNIPHVEEIKPLHVVGEIIAQVGFDDFPPRP